MNKKLYSNIVVVAVSCAALPATAQTAWKEPTGGFSMTTPRGWRLMNFPGMKYKILAAPNAGAFTPNLNVVDQIAPMSGAQYVDQNLQAISQILKSFKLLRKGDFVTTTGLKGTRIEATDSQNDRNLRQVFYFFEGKANRKYVVTLTVPAESDRTLDQSVDTAMKTFKLL